MAKKRKKTHHRTTRRRRMGSIHAGGFMNDLVEAAGFVVGHIGGGMLQKNFASLNPKIVSAAELVGGFMLKRHSKTPLMTGISYGLIGAGSLGIAQEFHVISGIDNFINGVDNEMNGGQEYLDEGRQNGLGNEHMLRGLANEPSLGYVG